MVEVQDIDALLIGALYGELTPADEARLAAHLESHPTDKTALEHLTHARGLIKPYIGELVDPPQAISALLLQEAVRRAPKKVSAASSEESWFTRFVRSFMAHPAMAAAAMLVVVIGVAGTMYMRKGSDQFADEKAPAVAETMALDRSRGADEGAKGNAATGLVAPAAPTAQPAAIGGAEGSGSAYGADLATTGKDKEALKLETEADAKKVAVAQAANERAKAVRHQGIQVKDGDALMPRELAAEAPMDDKKPEPRAEQKAEKADEDQQTRSGAGAAAPGGAPAQSAPPPPPAAPAKTVLRDSNTNAVSGADVSWTKTEHARAIAFVKAGKCDEAAKVAISIADRDPDYFAANVATDRALKPCMPAITQLRDVESEKTQKARAQKRVNANEPAPADNVK